MLTMDMNEPVPLTTVCIVEQGLGMAWHGKREEFCLQNLGTCEPGAKTERSCRFFCAATPHSSYSGLSPPPAGPS